MVSLAVPEAHPCDLLLITDDPMMPAGSQQADSTGGEGPALFDLPTLSPWRRQPALPRIPAQTGSTLAW